LVVTAGIAGQVGAINPTDDDAGSGRDAGDQPATAVPIEPGTHEGRVTETVDTRDHYSFAADEGDVVVVTVPDGGARLWVGLVGPDGEEHAYGADLEGVWLPIPEAGTWTVLVELTGASSDLPAAAVDYTFELERSQDYYVHERTVADGWYTAEAAVDEPGRLMGYVRGQSPQDPGEAYGNFGAVASWKAKPEGGRTLSWSAHAYGHGATSEGSPFAIASEILPGDDGAQAASFSPWSEGQILDSYAEAQMRLTALEAPSEHGLRVAIASTSPLEVREATGSEVVHWTTSDNEEETILQTGGVVATEAANLTVPTDHGLRGAFYTYDAGGEIHTPDGDCHEAGSGELFADPQAGSWEFRLNPVQDVGYTEHVYLVAADIPQLGTFDWGGNPPPATVNGRPCGQAAES
jgi:hypothetical protein